MFIKKSSFDVVSDQPRDRRGDSEWNRQEIEVTRAPDRPSYGELENVPSVRRLPVFGLCFTEYGRF